MEDKFVFDPHIFWLFLVVCPGKWKLALKILNLSSLIYCNPSLGLSLIFCSSDYGSNAVFRILSMTSKGSKVNQGYCVN